MNGAFERTWQTIVAHHGTDWLGFTKIRAAYLALHERAPRPWEASAAVPGAGARGVPRVLSIELWDDERGELASAEVGVLVGAATPA